MRTVVVRFADAAADAAAYYIATAGFIGVRRSFLRQRNETQNVDAALPPVPAATKRTALISINNAAFAILQEWFYFQSLHFPLGLSSLASWLLLREL